MHGGADMERGARWFQIPWVRWNVPAALRGRRSCAHPLTAPAALARGLPAGLFEQILDKLRCLHLVEFTHAEAEETLRHVLVRAPLPEVPMPLAPSEEQLRD